MTEAVKETKAIALVRAESNDLAENARNLVISTDDEARYASDMLTYIAQAQKKLEGQRTFLVGPLNQHVRDINAVFKEWRSPLEEADTTLRRKMLAWHTEVERAAEEERSVLEQLDVPADEIPDLPVKVVRSETGGSTSVVKRWTFEVVDEKAVPRAWLMLDEGVINLAIKDGTRKIKGLRIYQKESLAVRS